MKQSIKAFFLLLLTLYICCKKYKDTPDDIAGKTVNSIRGRLFLYDSITGNYDTVPLKNKNVSLGYPGAADPLRTIPTDSLGYFIFDNLDASRTYHLNYIDTGSGGVTYGADTVLKPGNDSVRFLAYPAFGNNNGLLYHFVTTADPTGPVPGVSACLFGNSGLVADTCFGSNYQLTSDMYGRGYQFHLRPGIYTVRIHVDYPNLKETLYRKDTITPTGLIVKKVVL